MDPESFPSSPVPLSAEGHEERLLLRVSAMCPHCTTRPALRVTPMLVKALSSMRVDARVGTYQCQRRGCGAQYDLTAEAFQNAS